MHLLCPCIAVLFPACAGVILEKNGLKDVTMAFPRMRGGDPAFNAAMGSNFFFSPHARG